MKNNEFKVKNPYIVYIRYSKKKVWKKKTSWKSVPKNSTLNNFLWNYFPKN